MPFSLDPATFKLFQDGDVDVFNKVYRLWEEPIYLLCLKKLQDRHDAEDATAEILNKLRQKRCVFESPRHLEASVHTYINHKCIDVWRRRERQSRADGAWRISLVHPDKEAASDWMSELERKEKLRDLIMETERLPSRCRTVCLLYYYEELSPEAIAAQLDIAVGTVYKQLERGKKKMRAGMRKKGW